MRIIHRDNYPHIHTILSCLVADNMGSQFGVKDEMKIGGDHDLDLIERQLSTLEDDQTINCPMWRFAAPSEEDEVELKPGREEAWSFVEDMFDGPNSIF